jgi:hypothetical protein
MLTYKLELMILDGANSVNMNYRCCATNPSIDTQFKKNRAHSPDPEEKDQRKTKKTKKTPEVQNPESGNHWSRNLEYKLKSIRTQFKKNKAH